MARVVKLLLGLGLCLVFTSYSFCANFFQGVFAKDFQYFLYDESKLIWVFKAKVFFQKNQFTFEGKDVIIESPEKNILISGKTATFDERRNIFKVFGNATFVTPSVGKILTSELTFYPDQGIVETEKEVVVKKKGMVIKGEGMTYYVKTGEFKLKKKAKIKFEL
ncbi:MAG: LPS export ABC transporter periplasmic protein LptC [Thermodesulfobacteria bacterium]|nr:LPS export ABC transporter periplasmic protein LptC [Thermodesulfobacteriota bacterium]